MFRLLAVRDDIKSNVKLGGFQSQLKSFYVSNPTNSCDMIKQFAYG